MPTTIKVAAPTDGGYADSVIQAALDASGGQGSDVELVDPFYAIRSIHVPSNTTLRGHGRYATQIYQLGGAGRPVVTAAGHNVVLQDLAVVGLGTPGNAGGIDMVGCTDSEILRCIVSYCNGFGVRMCGGPWQGDSMHNRILDNHIKNCDVGVLLDIPPGSNQSHPDGTILSLNNFQSCPVGLKVVAPTVDDSSSLLTDGVIFAMNETIEVERPIVAAATSLRVNDNRFEVTGGQMIFDYLAGTSHAKSYDVQHRGNTYSTYGNEAALVFNDATFDGVSRQGDFGAGNKKWNVSSSQVSMRALRAGVDQVPAPETGVVHLWADNSGTDCKTVLKARLGNGPVVTLASE